MRVCQVFTDILEAKDSITLALYPNICYTYAASFETI